MFPVDLKALMDEAFREELVIAFTDRFGPGVLVPVASLDELIIPGASLSAPDLAPEQARFIEGFAQGFFRSYLMGLRLAATTQAMGRPQDVDSDEDETS